MKTANCRAGDTPLDLARPTGREDEGGRDQRIGILAPDQILRTLLEHPEHPVMAGEVREIPRDGCIALAQQFCTIDQRDIVELAASHPFRLNDPEQACIVQIALGFGRQSPQLFGARRPVAKLRDERSGAGRHGGKGAVFRSRCCGLTCDRLLTNARHLAFLAFSLPLPKLRIPALRTRLTGRIYFAIVYRVITN